MVLVSGSKDSPLRFKTLADLPEGERIAIGEPETVPAGRYARDALQALGVWPSLEGRFVFTHDVAGVVAYVRRGEVAVGIAYGTEVVGIPDCHRLDTADGSWAPKPLVVAAAVREAAGEKAVTDLLPFLSSKEAAVIWQRHGFALP
jgi:molybdate transport system substrate-binding protein